MSFDVTRLFVFASVLASIAQLTPASAHAPAVCSAPSQLDYVVLASLADSSNLLTMSTCSPPVRDVAALGVDKILRAEERPASKRARPDDVRRE